MSPSFDVQGHRGARGWRPESTLPGIEIALDNGVPTVELDLHLTRDDVLVVWHDPVVSGAKCIGPGLEDEAAAPRIRELRYAQLAEYECKLNPDPGRFPDQRPEPTPLVGDDFRIVRLEIVLDFLERYADSGLKTRTQRENAAAVRLNLELKRSEAEPWRINDGFDGMHPATLEKELIRLLRKRGLTDRVTIQSFDHRSLEAVHSVAPEIMLSALTEGATDVKALADMGVSIWSPNHAVLTAALVDGAHAQGLRVVPWTVNDPGRMAQLIELGVDGLITDLGPQIQFSGLGGR